MRKESSNRGVCVRRKAELFPDRTRAFLAAAAAVGRTAELVPIGVYTGPDRKNPYSGVPQTACDYSGDCLLGCDLQAKNTLDITYIALAEKNGAEVWPLHLVEYIEPLAAGSYRVHFKRLDYDGDGNRVSETAAGVTTEYLVDTLNPTGLPQVVDEVVKNRMLTRGAALIL